MNKKVVFRLDAASHIGTGHMRRCMTLANRFLQDDWKVTFAMINFDPKLTMIVQDAGISLITLTKGQRTIWIEEEETWLSRTQEEDAIEFLSFIQGANYDLCIVDHYSLNSEWHSLIKKVIPNLVVIDDLANRSHDCSILLDQNYFPYYESRYDGLISPLCEKLLGPNYSLLREEFSILRNRQKPLLLERPTILCNFGGIGDMELLMKFITASKCYKKYKYIIVTGVLIEESYNLLHSQVENESNILLMQHSDNMAELMSRSDFCIGATGSTVWERFCLGLNSALIAVADNQKHLLEFLDKEDLIDNLGLSEDIRVDDFVDFFETLDLESFQNLNRKQKIMNLVDGNGAVRVYEKIKEVFQC